mmetsp:Transcript_140064/g.198526  ORF Transcript_140064/g.198526 Transcript_140064/m.198526 type:complete len:98 (-) Transcript_140064:100-393(-)
MKAHHESRASDEYRKMASTSPALKAKMCKELSSFGLQDAIKSSSANCFALRIAHCGKLSKQESSRSQGIAIPAKSVAKAHPIIVLLVAAPEVEQAGT